MNESSEEIPSFNFEYGQLTQAQLKGIFNALPLDLNFVDEQDLIVYYNRSKGQVWERDSEVMNKPVQDCHSPETVPFVNEVLEDLKSGRKEMVETHGEKDGRPVRWRYLAVRDGDSTYLGCLCITEYLDFGERIT